MPLSCNLSRLRRLKCVKSSFYPGEVGFEIFTKLELGAITLDEDGIEAYAVLDDHKRRRNDAT